MAQNKLNDDKSLECSICFSDFDEPKQLPCLHTFCLKCLKKYCEERSQYKRRCPLCLKTFSAYGELENLPNCELIERLVSMKQARELEMKSAKVCDLCAELGENIEAQAFCNECQQRLCFRCKQYHAVSSFSKFHQVVEIDTKSQLCQRWLSYCSSHSSKEMEFYCCDCNVLICDTCKFENHEKHNVDYFQEAVKGKKITFTEVENKIRRYYVDSCDKIKNLELERQTTKLQAKQAKLSINEEFDEIVKSLTDRRNELLDNVTMVKSRRYQLIDDQENLNHRQNANLNEFLCYGRMLLERGTDCEIIRLADELDKRAEELIKSQDERNKQKLPECCIKFIASPLLAPEDIEISIGEVVVRDNSTDQLHIKTIQHGCGITGITVLMNRLFVINCYALRVFVHDLNTGFASPSIYIADTLEPRGIVGCMHNKALYVSDFEHECIYRVDLMDETVSQWELKENYMPFGLAVTSEHNVLVTVRMRDTENESPEKIYDDEGVEAGCGNESRILEYTSEGQLIRDIELDRSIESALHTIPLSGDQFLVSHGSHPESLHRLCVVNSEGQIIRSYGGKCGKGAGDLYEPRSIAIDEKKLHVFVADRMNKRVLMFSIDLALLGQVQVHEYEKELAKPWSLYFDADADRLFIGYWWGDYVEIIDSPDQDLVEPLCPI